MQAVGQSQGSPAPAGPSIEDAAQLLQTVAHPVLLSLTNCESHGSHDVHSQQAETEQLSQHSDSLLSASSSSSSTDGSNRLVDSKGDNNTGHAQVDVGSLTDTDGIQLSLTKGSQLQIQVCYPAILPYAPGEGGAGGRGAVCLSLLDSRL